MAIEPEALDLKDHGPVDAMAGATSRLRTRLDRKLDELRKEPRNRPNVRACSG